MSIGKNSIARAVNSTAAAKTQSKPYASGGTATFQIEKIGILGVAKTPDDIEKLIQSVAKHGILCPVLAAVTDKGDVWLIDGYRRLLAARELGISQIDATVIKVTNKTQANSLYTEILKTKQVKENNSIHEEKFRVLAVKDHDLPAYLL